MATRSLPALAVALVAFGWSGAAFADAKGDVAQKSKAAMESYDLMDYDAAKRALNQALAAAKKAKLDRDPVTARVHLYLGIAAFAGGDADGAKTAFAAAVAIDPKIQIDAAYKSPELVKLLDQVRGGSVDEPVRGGSVDAGATDCVAVSGMQHAILDTGKANAAQPIEALVEPGLAPAKVSVLYRPEGATDFVEVKLTKQGDCRYTGAIPRTGMKGALVHYYVAAYDAGNKVVASKGSSGSPNIMELTAGGPAGPGDTEDPIGGGGGATGGEVSGGVIAGGKPARIYIAVAGGTGFGYVTGKTEFGNQVENCCIGSSLVVVTPELGYYINPRLSVGLAGRIGVPLGANLEGHSSIAPAALVRVRYALSDSGEGLRVMGQLGGGLLRNTIKLNNAVGGMDTDIVGQGPLLIGAGVGFTKKLSANFALLADLSALGAIAVVDKLGSTPNLNHGLAADLSLGVAVGF